MKTFILLSSVLTAGVIAPVFYVEYNISIMPTQIALVVAWVAVVGLLLIARADYGYPPTRKRAGETVGRRQQQDICRPVGGDSVIPSLGWIGKRSV